MGSEIDKNPSSIEFSLLEEVVLSPVSMNMILRTTRQLDDGALRYGHEKGYASNCLTHLLDTKAIELLDDSAVAFRKQYVAGGPEPVSSLRVCGQLDLSLLGARLYERGRQVRVRNPDEHKVTLYSPESGYVRHWSSGVSGERIELPGAELVKADGHWSIKATDGPFVGEPHIQDETLWRRRWWEVPRLGLHVEYQFEVSLQS